MKLRWAVPLVFLVVLALCLAGMAQNYAPATNYPTSAAPQGLARGDFNEDGKPDFAVTDFNASVIQIFPGNGDGTFGSPIATSIAPHPYSVAAADLDGDGHLDLVISLINAQGFEVLLGNGNGQFHSPVVYTVSGLPTTSTVGQAALKDINGDGKIDVVLATDRGISVFLNNGSGGFTQSPITIDSGNVIANVAVLDLNGDRIPDLVAAESTFDINGNSTGAVVYALGHGDGTFGPVTNIADFSGPPTGLAVADIDRDGLPDVVVSFATSTIGTGGGTGAVGCTPRICLPQDGGGGTTTVPGGIGLIRQTATLQFAATNSIGTDKNPGVLIAGDFDGDGRLDVAEASTALAQILVYRGNGDGTFAAALPLTLPSIAGEIATESFSGTVAQDLFASASSTNQVSVFVNQGANTLSLASSLNPAGVSQPVTLTATVQPKFASAGTLSGSVIFADGQTTLGTATVNPSGVATLPATFTTAGDHQLTAVYGGNSSFVGGSSASIVERIAVAPGVTLSSSINPSSVGQAVNFTATVAGSASGPIPSGTITLFANGAPVLSATVDASGGAILTTSSLPLGTNDVFAQYSGDSNYPGSDSPHLSQVVNKSNSTATLTSSLNPSTFGQSINFTASVTPVSGTRTPTGNVTLKDAGAAISTAALDATGTAIIGVSNLSVGTHSLTVDYAGDANFNASSSAAFSQEVNATSTSVVLTDSPNPSTPGQAVVLHALVKATTGTAIPSGSVVFSEGATVLGSANLDATGAATLSVTSLAIGSHNLTASYAGNTSFQGSTSAAVVQAVNAGSTSAVLTSSPNPSTTGQAVVLHAAVKAATGTAIPSGSVAFSDGATVLGSANLDTSGAASLTVTSFAIGSHTLTASYAGNTSLQGSTSAAVVQVVSTSSTSVALSTSPNPSTLGQAVALTAVVRAVTGGSPAGVVVFNEGTSVLGSANLDATGTAVLTLSSFAVGSHNLTATYAGNSNLQGSASAVVTQVVNRSAVQITIGSSANPAVFGQSVTLQIAVTPAVAGNTRIPTGSVSFTDGAAIIGQVPLDATGHAVFTTSNLSASTHTISATYAGDTNFLGASASLAQVINKATTATSLSSSLNPATNASTFTLHAVVTSAAGTTSGTVQFFDGAAMIGSAVLDNTGSASMSISNPAVGSHSVSSSFTGSSNLTSSASTAVSEAIVDSHSQVSLVSSTNPQTSAQPVVFNAIVTPALSGQPVSGTITFRDGAQILASVPVSNGGASLSTTQLAVGTHSIVAVYQASTAPGPFDGISAPVAQVIQSSLAPDYSVSIQPAKGSIPEGATFTTVVSVAPVNGFTGSVTLGCAGLPANASCAFVPAQVAITGQAPATSRLQIATSRYMSANIAPVLAKKNWGRMMALWFAPGVFGCVLFQTRKRLRMGIVVVCILACGLLISGCGSSSSSKSNQTHQAHTYNITVTASSGAVVHSTLLQLTLQ